MSLARDGHIITRRVITLDNSHHVRAEQENMKKKDSSHNMGEIDIAELINDMPQDALITVHNMIVDRLRVLQRQQAQQTMSQFRIGDTVCFNTNDGKTITGILVKRNKKSVTVHTEDGHSWNVAPQLLTKATKQILPDTLTHLSIDKNIH